MPFPPRETRDPVSFPASERGAGTEHLGARIPPEDGKTHADKETWLTLFRIWEKQYARYFQQKTASGEYQYRKIRSVRAVVRHAIPDLFTYLDIPGCPNTTNDVEGWINAAIAERIARHRGMKPKEKKVLVSVILSRLTREKPTRKSSSEKHT